MAKASPSEFDVNHLIIYAIRLSKLKLQSQFFLILQPICDLIAANEEVNNGSTLIHCMQGRSRSASLVIAYLLWKDGSSDVSDDKDKGIRFALDDIL